MDTKTDIGPNTYSDEFKSFILDMLRDREGTPDHDRWYAMAMQRVSFQQRHFLPTLKRFDSLKGKNVLEIGCGTGPTSVVMALEGALVTALDINPQMVEATRLRARDHGVSDRVNATCVESSDRLDFPSGSFDLVVCNGVLEHVTPKQKRAPLMREMWRVLKEGGELFIGETPNRLWPIDDHTTGLTFLHYMPAGLAQNYAKARHKILPTDDLQSMGGLGCSWWSLVHTLPKDTREVMNMQKQYSWLRQFSTKTLSAKGLPKMKRAVKKAGLTVLEKAFLRPFLHLPIDGLMPYLSLCIRKKPAGHAAA